ncbi:MAG TPA: cupredoxin domain-containing protein [Methanoregula sp.]|nr:cupredoxin domain-containing protein [Methanoregula sp.]
MPPTLRIPVVFACCLVILLAASGCTAPSAPSAQPAVTQAQATPAASSDVITIKEFDFTPSSLTVKAGTTVTWVNQGSETHTVSSDQNSPVQFASTELPHGASYSFTFSSPGVYPYHCSVHPSMVGTIRVEA